MNSKSHFVLKPFALSSTSRRPAAVPLCHALLLLSVCSLLGCSSGKVPREPAAESSANSGSGGESPEGTEDSSGTLAGGSGGGNAAMPSEGVQIFLLIGQSNMEGMPPPAAEDLLENERVQVLGYDACNGRSWNVWDTASPPLHHCWAGVGPGDGFGKAIAEAWPEATIGLVPCAISGVDIDFFRKGVVSARRDEFQIPPDNLRTGAYEMVIERARLAQEQGVIRGILFHQGESDTGNAAWVGKVAEMVADLRADLSLGEDVPFIAGELLYTGCCVSHNPLINQLPANIPNAHVVSAADLAGMDEAHFDLAGQRELGRRYAEAMLQALSAP